MNFLRNNWNFIFSPLQRKLLGDRRKKKLHSSELAFQLEQLESREMLAGDLGVALDAFPEFAMDTVHDPSLIRLSNFNEDPFIDLVALGDQGDLTVALNAGDGTWQSRADFSFGIGPLLGMEVILANDDAVADLILQGSDALYVALNDGDGRFEISQTISASQLDGYSTGSTDRLQLAVADLDGDLHSDFVVVSPASGQVFTLFGSIEGTFELAGTYASGAAQPVSLAVGNLIGDPLPDLAIGHGDGTVSMFSGIGNRQFRFRPELSLSNLGEINEIAASDVDEDGDQDLVVSAADRVTVLLNNDDPQPTSPLVNGDFSQGMTGWQTEIVGHPAEGLSGHISVLGGVAQLQENESFLVSLQQTFSIPLSPQLLEIDLVAWGFDDPQNGIPDAFEISLLDDADQPLTDTIFPNATALFNIDARGVISTESQVTFDGRTVTIDISNLQPGAQATLYLDLIGNPPASQSIVTVDNVRLTPAIVYDSSFELLALPGPFQQASSVVIADVDGDRHQDVVVTDSGLNQLIVFNGDGDGDFEREIFDLSPFGLAPTSVAAARLTPSDSIADVAIAMSGSDLVLTPLQPNTPPIAAVSGPSQAVRGEKLHFLGSFEDDSRNDSHVLDWLVTRDAAPPVVVAQGSGAELNFVPELATTYTITFTVTDAQGSSDTVTSDVVVMAARVGIDPLRPGERVLWLGGSAGDDTIQVKRGQRPGQIEYKIQENGRRHHSKDGHERDDERAREHDNNDHENDDHHASEHHKHDHHKHDHHKYRHHKYEHHQDDHHRKHSQHLEKRVVTNIDRVVIYGLGGDDDLQIDRNVGLIPAELYGGDGNDRLAGGRSDDFLSGGPGDDSLHGNDGRDVLVGGPDRDLLKGYDGQDILIGAVFAQECDRDAVRAILDEWSRPELDYNARVTNLVHGSGLNQQTALNTESVQEDFIEDKLHGGKHQDLLFEFATTLNDQQDEVQRRRGETVLPTGTPPLSATRFLVVDAHDDHAYRYNADLQQVGNLDLLSAKRPRGATTTGVGNRLWVVDQDKSVYVFDTSSGGLLGSWRGMGLKDPQGIAVHGSDIWVVDRRLEKILRFANAATLLSGAVAADEVIELAPENGRASGLTTDGNLLWVTDESDRAVYVYAISGSFLGSWRLATDNRRPTGITVDPQGGDDLWVVDRQSQAVFHYVGAKAWRGGAQTAMSVALNRSNEHAEGIADPAGTFNIGEVVSGVTPDGGLTDTWSFTATAGQTIFVDWQAESGGITEWRLFDPNGTQIATAAASIVSQLNRGPLVLATTGVYSLSIRERQGYSASYTFRILDVPAPDVVNLNFGEAVDGAIEVIGAEDHWTFAGTAGQQVFIDFASVSGGVLDYRLYDPSGAIVVAANSNYPDHLDRGAITLTQSGTYRIVAWGRNEARPSYRFTLWEIPADLPRPISLGTNVSDFRVPKQSFTYTFAGAAGQVVAMDVSENQGNKLRFSLYDPQGNPLFSNLTGDYLLDPLPVDGTYTLTVVSGNANDADLTAAFAFRLQEIVAPRIGSRDSQGTEFYVTFPRAQHENPSVAFKLLLTAAVDTTATISVASISFVQVVDIRAGQVATVVLPSSVEFSGNNDTIENKGVRITAPDEISLYGVSQENHSTDGFLALPVDAWGTEYVVLGYENTGRPPLKVLRGSQFAVVATADNTLVTIVPAVNAGNRLAQVPFTITLNDGQVYALRAEGNPPADLSGTRITADQPIGLFGGNRCAQVPTGFDACDYLIEQLPPTDSWGQRFLTAPLASRNGGDTFRILAQSDNTSVSLNGNPIAVLDAGQFQERIIDHAAELTANQPILVAQYANGSEFDGTLADPFMMLISPQEQFSNQYTFTTLDDLAFTQHFVNVAAPSGAVGAVFLDHVAIDANLFSPIGNSEYQAAQIPLAAGSHHISADLPFGISVYGFGTYDSYGFPGGMTVAPVAHVTAIDLGPESAAAGVGSSHAVTATVTDRNQQPLAGIRVDFQITGVHAIAGFAITDDFGRARFSYVGENGGNDTVVAFVGNVADTADIFWVTAPPLLTFSSPPQDSQFEQGSSVLITGRVVPGTPGAEIVNLLVGDRPVDGLDTAGNFFALVDLVSGPNVFEFTAIDSHGIQATQMLSLIGTKPAGPGLENLVTIPASASRFRFANTSFNRLLNEVIVNLSITNTGSHTISAGAIAAFGAFDSPAVSLSNADGNLDDGYQHLQLQTVVPASGLSSGGTSQVLPLRFVNAARDRFAFELSLREPANQPPRFTTAPRLTTQADQVYHYDAFAIDPDGESIVFTLQSGPADMTIDPMSGTIVWNPVATDVGNHNIQVIATDTRGVASSQAFLLTVAAAAPANRLPLIASAAITRFNLHGLNGNAAYQYQVVAIDPDHDSLMYSLAAAPAGMTIGMTIGSHSGLIEWSLTATDLGSHAVSVLIDDGNGNSARQDYVLNVVDVAAAEIRGSVFSDLDGDGARDADEFGLPGFTVYHDANRNAQLDAGELAVTSNSAGEYILSDLLPGTYFIRQVLKTGFEQTEPTSRFYEVNVAAGQSQAGFDFGNRPNAITANGRPLITSGPPLAAKVGSLYQYQLTARDPDGDPLTFTLLTAPQGMTIEPHSGLMQWTPSPEQQSTLPVLVQVDDGQGNLDLQSFSIYTRPQFQVPSIVSEPPFLATVNQPYQYDVMVEAADVAAVTLQLVAGPAGMTLDADTGAIHWNPSAAQHGLHQVVIRAVNTAGLAATQSFALSVRDVNLAPLFTSQPILSAAAGEKYLYDAVASDSEDAITFSLVAFPTGMQIDSATGQVTWQPTASNIGMHEVKIRAADERGLFSEQEFALEIAADELAPRVAIIMTGTLRQPGQPVTVQVVANDNAGVAAISLSIDGTPVALSENNTFELTPEAPGLVLLQATATDQAGNVGTASRTLRVIDPLDSEAPLVQLVSPAPDSRITYLTDIVGSVFGDDLELYRLQYSLLGQEQWVTFAEQTFLPSTAAGAGQVNLADAVLGVFDPTLLANDLYDIRLVAQDFSGNLATSQIFVSVAGQAKLGNFRLEFTDLTIPLTGIPITINRVYDTLDADFAGDFGYGWHLSLSTARIREATRVSEFEQAGVPPLFGAHPFRTGTRVYLNTPEGRRVGFTFDPVPVPGFLGTVWHPRFIADPGVYETLAVDDVALSQNADGTFGVYLIGLPYNPRQYKLTTKENVTFRYDQFNELQDITDRNGVRLTYTDNGIFSSVGESIQFIRDDQGRITQIVDPAGNSIRYSYDSAGNLTEVIDRVDNSTSLTYQTDRQHFLDEIFGPSGNLVSRTQYDAAGRVASISDAKGNPITQSYDLAANTEVLGDRLGNETTIIFDDRGNVTRLIDSRGAIIDITYDEFGNQIAITDANGQTTSFEYDAAGNQTKVTRPDGSATVTAFNDHNQITQVTYAGGTSQRWTYDERGNLLNFVNAMGQSTTAQRDAVGRATSIVDPRGIQTRFEYGSFAEPSRTTFADGSARLFVRNAAGQVTSFTDERGQNVSFSYDAAGRLLEAVDALGQSNQYVYQADVLSQTVDALGRVTAYVFDENRNLVQMIDALGGITQYQYDANGNRTKYVDSLGRESVWTYADNLLASFTSADGATTSYAYDGNVNLVAQTDARGATTSYQYDAMNRLVGLTDALDGSQSFAYNIFDDLVQWTDANGGRSSFEYDALQRLVQATDALGHRESWAYDLSGNIAAYTNPRGFATNFNYDDRNRRISVSDADGGLIAYGYDQANNVTSITDQLGFVTTYQYDANNQLRQVVDALGGVEQYEYDAVGNNIAYRDALGRETTFVYDDLNRLIISRDPLGGEIQRQYDAVGNLLALTDPLGNISARSYDNANRLLTATDPLGYSIAYQYDAVGNLVGTTDELGNTTQYVYDLLNRQTAMVDALGGHSSYEYDPVGNLTRSIDQLGSATQLEYDAIDQLVATVDTLGGRTSSAYDENGNLVSVVDPLGNTTVFEYDALDRRIRDIDPLGQVTVRSFDAVSNLVSVTDRNQRTRGFQYDPLRRLTWETWLDAGGAVVESRSYAYDAVGNLLEAEDSHSRYVMAYDALDRLTSINNAGSPGSLPHLILQYAYDANSNVTSISDQTGVSVAWTYDPRDLAASMVWSGGEVDGGRVEFTYDARGIMDRVSRFADGGGQQLIGTSDYQFDALGRLTSLSHADSAFEAIAGYEFEYDVAGRLTRQVVNGAEATFAYDNRNQLTAADYEGQGDEGYAYDANGNRIGGGYSVAPNNQILSDGTYDYQYDAEGNLILKTEIASGDFTEYVYDHQNRLTRATLKTAGGVILQETEFTYDIFDRRIAKTLDADGAGTAPAETVFTLYEGQHAWADFDQSGNVLARYLFGSGTDQVLARWRAADAAGGANGTAWYLTDQLGSVRDIVDTDGQLIDRIVYGSFGLVISESDPQAGDRFKFTGREYDRELELYYYRARYYDPRLGRFLSEDPLSFVANDTNLYRYVANNPLTSTDPSGLLAVSSFAAATKFSRVFTAIASGFVGYGLGYACGYLTASCVMGLSGQEAEFYAQREGLLAASIDISAGLTLGRGKGSLLATGIFLAGAAALGAGSSYVTSHSGPSADSSAGSTGSAASDHISQSAKQLVSFSCFAVSAVAGHGANRGLNAFANSRTATRLINQADDFLNSAEGRLDIGTLWRKFRREAESLSPRNTFISSLADIGEFGLSANRIRLGTNGKVAIIGRGMEKVRQMRDVLMANGVNVEIFDNQITRSMMREFDELKKAGANAADFKQTRLFEANRRWAQKLADEGYTVIDAGDQLGRFAEEGWSVFYAIEKLILF